MFPNLKNTILKLNEDIADVANQEKAKQLRKKLLKWGAVCLAIGLIGIIVCFSSFAIIGFTSVNKMSDAFPFLILIPFCLFITFIFVTITGTILLRLGLSILIAGATTKFVDKSINKHCECGNTLTDEDKFCPKCGRAAIKFCPNCKTENELENQYCSNCGQKLQ